MALRPIPGDVPIELSEGDAPAVERLYSRCADYFILQDGAASTPADARALFTDVPPGNRPSDQIVLAWRRGESLDCVAAILPDYPSGDVWYLGFMLVDSRLRGRGLGRSMYAAIEKRAAERGAAEIRLAELESNEAGERFWRSLGFDEVRRVGPDRFKERLHRRVELRRRIA
jgi:ribosomal protein S18 acetylase RimI-like enzyme